MPSDSHQICLYGGTFDPPHLAHLVLAHCVLERHGFDQMVFLPAAISPLKDAPSVSPAHRLAMLELALVDNPAFVVDARELGRAGESFTAHTVREYLRERPGASLSFVIGADQVAQLKRWREIDYLIEHVRFIAALRPPFGAELWQQVERELGAGVARQLESDAVRIPQLELSSTELREWAQQGRSLRYLVPDAVREYIARHALYRG